MRTAVAALTPEQAQDAPTAWAGLAKIAQPEGPFLPQEKVEPQKTLPASWLSWLADSSLTGDDRNEFLNLINTRPPLYLRVNYNEKVAEIQADLESAGYAVTTFPRPSGLITLAVVGEKPIYELKSLKSGWVEIQDSASQLIGEAVDAHPGMAVWDVCAGGGGKTLQIASQMQNRGVLYASDIRDYKLDELKLRARRGGFHNVRRFVYDAENPPTLTKEINNTGGFHRLLVDAPCTASGTLRRNPDVRFRIMPGDPEKFAALQLKILRAVQANVRPQGKLIYATCSVFRTENEAVVDQFLGEYKDFKLEQSTWVGAPLLNADTMFFAVLSKHEAASA